MTYTGEVTPGGAPQTRELTHLTITKLAVDPKMSNNAYLLTCRSTGESVLIDAAYTELAVRALHAAYGLDQL